MVCCDCFENLWNFVNCCRNSSTSMWVCVGVLVKMEYRSRRVNFQTIIYLLLFDLFLAGGFFCEEFVSIFISEVLRQISIVVEMEGFENHEGDICDEAQHCDVLSSIPVDGEVMISIRYHRQDTHSKGVPQTVYQILPSFGIVPFGKQWKS